ncbi:hypothetical protein GMRT_15634 [Giardia muris]|uniref:CFA20 domain-containing protein n=1 Tax=Giardia muris TaxID=5742 RepID=A0A4Z1SV05_GIAMU|nr:hypothetical protein GMRT_15634 [Giardia muris]|eukprot:TNJ28775.1 hypothetical protein GMRT_15634 [Giardia muris]
MPATSAGRAPGLYMACVDVFKHLGVPQTNMRRKGTVTTVVDPLIRRTVLVAHGVTISDSHLFIPPTPNSHTFCHPAPYAYIQVAPSLGGEGGGSPLQMALVCQGNNGTAIKLVLTNVACSEPRATASFITIPLSLSGWTTIALDLPGIFAAAYNGAIRYSGVLQFEASSPIAVKGVYLCNKAYSPAAAPEAIQIPPPLDKATHVTTYSTTKPAPLIEYYSWVEVGFPNHSQGSQPHSLQALVPKVCHPNDYLFISPQPVRRRPVTADRKPIVSQPKVIRKRPVSATQTKKTAVIAPPKPECTPDPIPSVAVDSAGPPSGHDDRESPLPGGSYNNAILSISDPLQRSERCRSADSPMNILLNAFHTGAPTNVPTSDPPLLKPEVDRDIIVSSPERVTKSIDNPSPSLRLDALTTVPKPTSDLPLLGGAYRTQAQILSGLDASRLNDKLFVNRAPLSFMTRRSAVQMNLTLGFQGHGRVEVVSSPSSVLPDPCLQNDPPDTTVLVHYALSDNPMHVEMAACMLLNLALDAPLFDVVEVRTLVPPALKTPERTPRPSSAPDRQILYAPTVLDGTAVHNYDGLARDIAEAVLAEHAGTSPKKLKIRGASRSFQQGAARREQFRDEQETDACRPQAHWSRVAKASDLAILPFSGLHPVYTGNPLLLGLLADHTDSASLSFYECVQEHNAQYYIAPLMGQFFLSLDYCILSLRAMAMQTLQCEELRAKDGNDGKKSMYKSSARYRHSVGKGDETTDDMLLTPTDLLTTASYLEELTGNAINPTLADQILAGPVPSSGRVALTVTARFQPFVAVFFDHCMGLFEVIPSALCARLKGLALYRDMPSFPIALHAAAFSDDGSKLVLVGANTTGTATVAVIFELVHAIGVSTEFVFLDRYYLGEQLQTSAAPEPAVCVAFQPGSTERFVTLSATQFRGWRVKYAGGSGFLRCIAIDTYREEVQKILVQRLTDFVQTYMGEHIMQPSAAPKQLVATIKRLIRAYTRVRYTSLYFSGQDFINLTTSCGLNIGFQFDEIIMDKRKKVLLMPVRWDFRPITASSCSLNRLSKSTQMDELNATPQTYLLLGTITGMLRGWINNFENHVLQSRLGASIIQIAEITLSGNAQVFPRHSHADEAESRPQDPIVESGAAKYVGATSGTAYHEDSTFPSGTGRAPVRPLVDLDVHLQKSAYKPAAYPHASPRARNVSGLVQEPEVPRPDPAMLNELSCIEQTYSELQLQRSAQESFNGSRRGTACIDTFFSPSESSAEVGFVPIPRYRQENAREPRVTGDGRPTFLLNMKNNERRPLRLAFSSTGVDMPKPTDRPTPIETGCFLTICANGEVGVLSLRDYMAPKYDSVVSAPLAEILDVRFNAKHNEVAVLTADVLSTYAVDTCTRLMVFPLTNRKPVPVVKTAGFVPGACHYHPTAHLIAVLTTRLECQLRDADGDVLLVSEKLLPLVSSEAYRTAEQPLDITQILEPGENYLLARYPEIVQKLGKRQAQQQAARVLSRAPKLSPSTEVELELYLQRVLQGRIVTPPRLRYSLRFTPSGSHMFIAIDKYVVTCVCSGTGRPRISHINSHTIVAMELCPVMARSGTQKKELVVLLNIRGDILVSSVDSLIAGTLCKTLTLINDHILARNLGFKSLGLAAQNSIPEDLSHQRRMAILITLDPQAAILYVLICDSFILGDPSLLPLDEQVLLEARRASQHCLDQSTRPHILVYSIQAYSLANGTPLFDLPVHVEQQQSSPYIPTHLVHCSSRGTLGLFLSGAHASKFVSIPYTTLQRYDEDGLPDLLSFRYSTFQFPIRAVDYDCLSRKFVITGEDQQTVRFFSWNGSEFHPFNSLTDAVRAEKEYEENATLAHLQRTTRKPGPLSIYSEGSQSTVSLGLEAGPQGLG